MEAYNSLNLIGIIGSRRMRGVGHVAPRGRGRVQNAVWKPTRQRSLGRTRRRWDNNIKMGFGERVCWRHGMDFGENL